MHAARNTEGIRFGVTSTRRCATDSESGAIGGRCAKRDNVTNDLGGAAVLAYACLRTQPPTSSRGRSTSMIASNLKAQLEIYSEHVLAVHSAVIELAEAGLSKIDSEARMITHAQPADDCRIRVTQQLAACMASPDQQVRTEATVAALRKMLIDIQMASVVLWAGEHVRSRRPWSGIGLDLFQTTVGAGSLNRQIAALLGKAGEQEASPDLPTPHADASLRDSVVAALEVVVEMIISDTVDFAGSLISALVALGSGGVAQSRGILGLDPAQFCIVRDGSSSDVLFRTYILAANDCITILLSNPTAEMAAMELLQQSTSADRPQARLLLDRLLETSKTMEAARSTTGGEPASSEVLIASRLSLELLARQFHESVTLSMCILRAIRLLEGAPALSAPFASWMLASLCTRLGAFVVLAAADCVGSRRRSWNRSFASAPAVVSRPFEQARGCSGGNAMELKRYDVI